MFTKKPYPFRLELFQTVGAKQRWNPLKGRARPFAHCSEAKLSTLHPLYLYHWTVLLASIRDRAFPIQVPFFVEWFLCTAPCALWKDGISIHLQMCNTELKVCRAVCFILDGTDIFKMVLLLLILLMYHKFLMYSYVVFISCFGSDEKIRIYIFKTLNTRSYPLFACHSRLKDQAVLQANQIKINDVEKPL